jgi:hypothetical protein
VEHKLVGPENEAKLKSSVQRLGLFKPIIVRRSRMRRRPYEILGGEHRWRDAVEGRQGGADLRSRRDRRHPRRRKISSPTTRATAPTTP